MDVKAAGSVLTLILILIGLSVAGGCNSDRQAAETLGGASLPRAEAVELFQPPDPGPDATRRRAVASRPEDGSLDPFALIPIGIGLDGYSSACELIDDPYGDCL